MNTTIHPQIAAKIAELEQRDAAKQAAEQIEQASIEQHNGAQLTAALRWMGLDIPEPLTENLFRVDSAGEIVAYIPERNTDETGRAPEFDPARPEFWLAVRLRIDDSLYDFPIPDQFHAVPHRIIHVSTDLHSDLFEVANTPEQALERVSEAVRLFQTIREKNLSNAKARWAAYQAQQPKPAGPDSPEFEVRIISGDSIDIVENSVEQALAVGYKIHNFATGGTESDCRYNYTLIRDNTAGDIRLVLTTHENFENDAAALFEQGYTLRHFATGYDSVINRVLIAGIFTKGAV